MILLEALLELLAEILFESISHGIGDLFRGIVRIFQGKPFFLTKEEKIERRFIHKTVSVSLKFHEAIQPGTLGKVLAVREGKTAIVEFRDKKSEPILVDGKPTVHVPLSHLRIKRIRAKK